MVQSQINRRLQDKSAVLLLMPILSQEAIVAPETSTVKCARSFPLLMLPAVCDSPFA